MVRTLSFAAFGLLTSLLLSCGSGNDGSTTRYLFVTSDNLGISSFGSAVGADAKCATYAQGGGLSGTFKAYITDGTTTAAGRLSDLGPWYLVKTTTVGANNLATFVTGFPTNINIDQNGNAVGTGNAAWTGMSTGGAIGNHCANWSDLTTPALDGHVASSLGAVSLLDCSSGVARLLCVQQ